MNIKSWVLVLHLHLGVKATPGEGALLRELSDIGRGTGHAWEQRGRPLSRDKNHQAVNGGYPDATLKE